MQRLALWVATATLFVATTAAAQSSGIAGSVRDSSGGVLPGVTVEAASPALIERTRSAVTDSQGRYNIVDLRPGVYSVTFTLTGFSTVRREKIELATAFTANVNVDLKVGTLEETITVSGASPLGRHLERDQAPGDLEGSDRGHADVEKLVDAWRDDRRGVQ